MASPGTIRPFIGDRLVQYLGSNCTVDDLLASSSDAATGTVWFGAQSVAMISSSTGAALTRNAAGDYSWNRTAAGAETHYAVAQVEAPLSTTAAKGIKVTGFWISYTLGVADATSVTPTVQLTSYVNAVANAVTTPFGTLTYDANHNTAGKRLTSSGGTNPHLMNVLWPTVSYLNTRAALITVETAFVLAINGTLAVNGVGFDFTFNYNGA